jgi:hypothetical protein
MNRLANLRQAIMSLAIMLLGTTAADAQARRPEAAATTINFFIHGHEDDWQIFMSPFVNIAAQAGQPIVFIYATAGDAGRAQPYWAAREMAALASQSVMSGQQPGNWSWGCASQTIFGHPIWRCSYGNFAAYFMRSPDGNSSDGCGYDTYNHQSLSRLEGVGACQPAGPMTAVDNSTTYKDWPDFWQTLRTLIVAEAATYQNVWINAPDYDIKLNPGDHPDHIATGNAVRCAAGGANCGASPATPQASWNTRWFVGYDIGTRTKDVTATEFTTKSAMLMAYDREMWDQWDSKQNCTPSKPCHSTLCSAYVRYSDWLFRMYTRTGP